MSGEAKLVFGTQDLVTSGTGTVAAGAYAYVGATWTNTDDYPLASIIIKMQYDATMPALGSTVQLYARPLNIQSTDDSPIPDSNYIGMYLGDFIPDIGETADVDFLAILPAVTLPLFKASQELDFYIYNNNAASRVIGTGWSMWVTPWTHGPAA